MVTVREGRTPYLMASQPGSCDKMSGGEEEALMKHSQPGSCEGMI